MNKGFRYPRFKCTVCGKVVAENWVVVHVKEHRNRDEHPKPLRAYFEEEVKTEVTP